MAEFATAEQIEAATRALRAWEQQFPQAAEALKGLWRQHISQVGHKRLGRLLLGVSVKPYAGPAGRRGQSGL